MTKNVWTIKTTRLNKEATEHTIVPYMEKATIHQNRESKVNKSTKPVLEWQEERLVFKNKRFYWKLPKGNKTVAAHSPK